MGPQNKNMAEEKGLKGDLALARADWICERTLIG